MGAKIATLSIVMKVEGADSRLEYLFDLHQERLYGLARRLSTNVEDAKDLVQETYLRAAQKLSSCAKGRSRRRGLVGARACQYLP